MLRYGWILLVLTSVGVLIATGTTKAQDAAGILVTHSPRAAATADRVLVLSADGLTDSRVSPA